MKKSSMKAVSAMKSAPASASAKATAIVSKANEKGGDVSKKAGKKKTEEDKKESILENCGGEVAASIAIASKQTKKKLERSVTDEDRANCQSLLNNRFRGEDPRCINSLTSQIVDARKAKRDQTGLANPSISSSLTYGTLTKLRGRYYAHFYGLAATEFEKTCGKREGNPNSEFMRALALEYEWAKLRPTVVSPLNIIESLGTCVALCCYPVRRKQTILLNIAEEVSTADKKDSNNIFSEFDHDSRIMCFMGGELSTLLAEEVDKQSKLGELNIRLWLKQREYALPYLGNNFKTLCLSILNAQFWGDESKSIKMVCRNRVGRSLFGHLETQLIQSDLPAEMKKNMLKITFGLRLKDLAGLQKRFRAICIEVIEKYNLKGEKKQMRWNTDYFNCKIHFNCTPLALCDAMTSLLIKERFHNFLPPLPGMVALKSIYDAPEPIFTYHQFLDQLEEHQVPATLLGDCYDFQEFLPPYMLNIYSARKIITEKAKAKSMYPGISTMINVMENSYDDYRLTDSDANLIDLNFYRACFNFRDQLCVSFLPKIITGKEPLAYMATQLKEASQSAAVVFMEKTQLVESWGAFLSNLRGGYGAIAVPSDLSPYDRKLMESHNVSEADLYEEIKTWENVKPSVQEVERISTWAWCLDEDAQQKVQTQVVAIGNDAVGGVYGDIVRRITDDINQDGEETGAIVIADTINADANIPDLFDMILNN